MSSERVEWVEIIEPRSKEHMYANLLTGECVWDPPEGVPIKRTDSSQWWELFDTNTQRFYYYNVASQTTVWHRPQNCDIIPLAKLQTLKQNTDSDERKDGCTQTKQSAKPTFQSTKANYGADALSRQLGQHSQSRALSSGISDEKISSPHGRHSYRVPTSDQLIKNVDSFKNCRHSHDSIVRNKHKESGKSSDSSLSSAQGYRRINESGSLRLENSHRKKHLSDNSYQVLQESLSSHNIPQSSIGIVERHSQQLYPSNSKLTYSVSNSSDLGCLSPTHSTNTPIFNKKRSSENLRVVNTEIGSSADKHQSFDKSCANNSSILSLTRSGSFMSSPTKSRNSSGLMHSSHRKTNTDGNGGAGSDDSMHEKYFKSVESTPLTRRKHASSSKSSNKKTSSDSSPQSPISPQNVVKKAAARPSVLNSINSLEPPKAPYLNISSSQCNDTEFANMDLTRKPEKYMGKIRIDTDSPISSVLFGTNDNSRKNEVQKGKLLKLSPSGSQGFPEQYLHKSKTERLKENKNIEKSVGKVKKRGKQHGSSSDIEYDNGNISPLYSNWDQEMQEHLLPLQHYIMEQAKLSGCAAFGDPLDSDSYHSDSQSEHSFSGHEPDNEDSDHSDHCDYLSHNYGLINDYASNADDGVSYYAYQFGAFDRTGREDISDHVEAVLEGERDNTKVYSAVQSHGAFYLEPESYKQTQIQQKTQSQTLPSPNRQIPKIISCRDPGTLLKQESQFKEESSATVFHKNTIGHKSEAQQIFPPCVKVTSSSSIFNVQQLGCMKECDIEKFAQDNLNLHSKGIFRKKSSVRDMLSFTADAISRPMLALAKDKSGKKMATELFKLVQIYMGDRKARIGMSLNSVAIDITIMALGQQQLQDELYVQLCRQTTENPKRESLIRGWELMAICLSFVPPSPTFQPALLNYVNRHRDPTFATSFPELRKWPIHVQISHYASVCCRRLDRIGSSGRKQAKKPNEDEIEQSRNHILRDSMFGNTLAEVMQLQKDKFPNRKLPWIQVTLSEQVLILNGKQTEGIFRVSADVDEVSSLKNLLDRWEVPEPKNITDAHAPASLLKLWYRELYDPLIPDILYDECVKTEDPVEAEHIINKLPELNKLVLTYLVHFLQQFIHPEVVGATKMDSSNLAMVFAPNCLRCMSDDPKIILENARKEMAFMRTLIQHMDTSSVAKMV